MRSFLTFFLGLLLTAAVVAQPERPNIVIFLADDLSIKDTTPYGGKVIPTPHMAALAKDGMTFERAYVASPSCAPSRAALLTGMYPVRNGAVFNHQKIQQDIRRWPAYFHDQGYQVVSFGKVSHYKDVQDYGFDIARFFNYHQDICIEKCIEWMAQRKSTKPLCLLVGTNWPHVPWPQEMALPPGEMDLPARNADTEATRKARARYASAVKNADRDLGMIREALAKHIPGDTFFLFTADHGSQFPFAKWNLYEAGLNVPLIVSWPGQIKPGTRSKAMVSWIDILPTVANVAGVKSPGDKIDGTTFLPVLTGKKESHREAIFGTHSGDGNMNFYPSRSARSDRWKYIRNLDDTLSFHTHVDKASQDTGYWRSWVEAAKTRPEVQKLIDQYHKRPAEELYDLSKDPDELVNLAADPAHKEDLTAMRKVMDDWMKSTGDKGLETDLAVRPGKKN